MPILTETAPRMGCLAVPISAIGGFVLVALVAAAFGAGATTTTGTGAVGMLVGALAGLWVLRRTTPDHGRGSGRAEPRPER